MIPGGIGSFDLIVITGLTSMGVSNALAVSLLLLFRLTYYIIPFLLGVVFFSNTWEGVSTRNTSNFLHEYLVEVSTAFFVYLLRFQGFSDFVSPNPRTLLANVYFISRFNPIQEQLIWQFPGYPIWNSIHFHGSAHQASG